MTQFTQSLSSQFLNDTTVWGYNGQYPGATFLVNRDEAIYVKYINNLPDQQLLIPVDTTIMGGTLQSRVTAHLHGGHVEAVSDGDPLSWFTNDPNAPANGTGGPDFPGDYSVVPEFLGNTILVNGKVWPYMSVEKAKYRIHLLDGSSSRFYDLYLVPASQIIGAHPTGFNPAAAIPFYKIGTDQGFLEDTQVLTHALFAPGERLDTIFDFSNVPGGDYILVNRAPDGMVPGDTLPADINTTGQIMKIHVGRPARGRDTFSLPMNPGAVISLDPDTATVIRQISLDETTDEYGRLIQTINLTPSSAPCTEFPVLDTTEIWQFMNTTVGDCPVHIGDEAFQVLGFQALLSDGQGGFLPEVDPNAPYIPIDPNGAYAGWKDTFICPSGYMSEIIVQFGDYTGDYTYYGLNENFDMSRPFNVRESAPVPEPSSWALIGAGLAGVVLTRRRKKQRQI